VPVYMYICRTNPGTLCIVTNVKLLCVVHFKHPVRLYKLVSELHTMMSGSMNSGEMQIMTDVKC